jgi:peptidoglycan-associated lipoprotein
MRERFTIIGIGMSLVMLSFFIVGCGKNENVKKDIDEEITSFTDEPVIMNNLNNYENSYNPEIDNNFEIVYFAFDKSDLSDESLKSLKNNVSILAKNTSLKIVIEGHTDNRGTSDYNLSLGWQRALKVKEYYISLGIDPQRIRTISYGSERPAINENNDSAWAKNRRAETKIDK